MNERSPVEEPVPIRTSTPADWRELKRLRLEMLRDTPLAFGDRIDAASGYPDGEWKMRAERAARPDNCCAVAVERGGRFIGTMSAFVAADGRAKLVTVYVSPLFRGRGAGLADRLLDFVEAWVTEGTDATVLALDVHEQNATARAFYRRRGFEETGRTQPYPLDPTQRERELEKPLR